MVSPDSRDLKESRLAALTASSGRLFQIRVTSGRMECLAAKVMGVGYPKLVRVSSRPCVEARQVIIKWDVDKPVAEAVHHRGAGFGSPLSEGVPSERVEHIGHAAFTRVVSTGEACIPPLGALQLVDVALGMWVPDRPGIL